MKKPARVGRAAAAAGGCIRHGDVSGWTKRLNSRFWPRQTFLIFAFGLLVLTDGASAADRRGFSTVPLDATDVVFDPSEPQRSHFGKLRYRGGLTLSSENSRFGGFSALGLDATGERLLAISDRSDVLEVGLVYDDNRLVGVREPRMGPLVRSNGKKMRGKYRSDAEALAFGSDGRLWVSFEHRHRIEVRDFGKRGLKARPRQLPMPPPFDKLPENAGVEAMVRFGPGSGQEGVLLLFAETEDPDGTVPGLIVNGENISGFRLDSRGGYDVTDMAILPGGDVVVLERRLGNLIDFSIRLRRIDGGSIKPGATLDGEILFKGGLSFAIDNFEGLAVHVTAAGETRLTLISDDNFSPIQQTLLLQFAIVDE